MATATATSNLSQPTLAAAPPFKKTKKSIRLTLWPLVAATFFMVSGGTYGTEDIVHGAGYGGERLGIFGLLTRGASCGQFLCLPPQATHSHHRVSLENFSRLPGARRFPGISAKLVRKCEITGIFHRCKIFLNNFANFCNAREWDEGNAQDWF